MIANFDIAQNLSEVQASYCIFKQFNYESSVCSHSSANCNVSIHIDCKVETCVFYKAALKLSNCETENTKV